MSATLALYAALANAGLDVVLDDRDRPLGAKFADADLWGMPVRVTIGKKTLADGVAEVSDRSSEGQDRVPLAQVPAAVVARLESLVGQACKGEKL